jgi:hypothetical protein
MRVPFESAFGQENMSRYSVARGRKKEVEKFTFMQGLRILTQLLLFGIFILLLMIFGVLHVDVD